MSDLPSHKHGSARGVGGSDGKRTHIDHASQYLSAEEADKLGKRLYDACGYGRPTAEAKRLVSMRASVDWQNENGRAPLHAASWHGNLDTVILLIERKADLNITNSIGNTPLIDAAHARYLSIAHRLVDAGADITIRGYKNKTAAEIAEKFGCHFIAQYLNTEALRIRFKRTARMENGQLHSVKGRSFRVIERDLKGNGNFDDHMLARLTHFCLGRTST